MARAFNQHADAGRFHLETRYVDPNHWEWFVLEKKTKRTHFSGDAKTLDGAKKSAATAVGLMTARWQNIGPVI